ncbi:MAG: Sensor protein resE, partial [Parcubacteria group bacterium GW2011_GWF2_38_76]
MDFKTIELLIVGLINALCVMLAVWIYYSNHRATENKLFSIFSIFALLWIDFGYFSLHLGDKLCILLTRLNVGVVPIFFIIFYLFSLSFSGQSIRKSLINKTVVFSGMLVFITSTFTSLVVKSVVIHSWGTSLVVGSLADFYYIWIVLVLGLIIYTQTKQLRSSSGPEKSKISMFLIGFFVFAAINIIVNVLFPVLFHTNQYYKFGDYSIIIFIGLTAYAIMKHQLFNIKVIATETTVIALSIGLLVEILLSNDLTEGLLKGMVWVLATYGGYVLVKSVKTEIKQKEKLGVLARKLEQANDHLKELDETKDNFLSMAAHELNTPIAAINGYLSMLVDENLCGPINKDATKYLEQIYGSSKRLANLVKDLLNVSRIESNRIHIIYTEAQMEDVIKQSIGEVAIKAKEAGHKLSFEQPSHK